MKAEIGYLVRDGMPVRIVCSYCERSRLVRADGKVRVHQASTSRKHCAGSGTDHAGHAPSPYGIHWELVR